jgi:hypothetical protein
MRSAVVACHGRGGNLKGRHVFVTFNFTAMSNHGRSLVRKARLKVPSFSSRASHAESDSQIILGKHRRVERIEETIAWNHGRAFATKPPLAEVAVMI